jgi:hypothetical protein
MAALYLDPLESEEGAIDPGEITDERIYWPELKEF